MNNVKRFIVLNSGGFDSVVLTHRVRQMYPDAEIISLFFSYEQPNREKELKSSIKCARDTNCEKEQVVVIPEFSWTKGDFFNGTSDTEKQYVEYRNLVFLSYAVSIAEAENCSKIFMATHYFPPERGFKDCDNSFIENFNATIKPSGIEVVTPFASVYKEDLMTIAREHNITPKDFFSCNNPNAFGRPCGECADCLILKKMYSC